MTPGTALALLLASAVAVAWIRLLLRQRRMPGPRVRLVLLMALQPLCAGLLYLTLLPPTLSTEPGTMTVLTAGATRDLVSAQASGEILVAMPESPPLPDAGRMPDLATALRRHPGTVRLQVVGHGLDPRDLDAARGHALDFKPPPLPPGLVRLDGPARAAAGASLQVAGRVNALEGGRVRLLDPAGRTVDGAELHRDGAFGLRGYARAPGLVTFSLQVLDADGREVESAAVPVNVADDPPPRVLLLSGAPNAEFRHLRRWAEDAGLDLHVEVAVGKGVGLGDGPAPADAEGFGEYDLVILDDRVLGTLGASRRAALAQALDGGTGVLVRTGGALSASVRGHMADLGLAVDGDAGTEAVAFPQVDDAELLRARLGPGSPGAPFDPALAGLVPPELSRRALRPRAGDAVALPAAGADMASGWWRAQGRGRIGLWTLTDSYRLALAGRADLHAGLWSAAVAALARPVAGVSPRFEAGARAGRRMAICGLEEARAEVVAPNGDTAAALVDPGTGTDRCAAYWPQAGGWHVLRMGEDAWPFHVREADGAPGLAAAALQEATLRLAGGSADLPAVEAGRTGPRRGASWPWFLAWLAVAGALWWLERRRLPTAQADPAVSRRRVVH